MLDFLMDTANVDCHDVVNFNDKDGADVEWVSRLVQISNVRLSD